MLYNWYSFFIVYLTGFWYLIHLSPLVGNLIVWHTYLVHPSWTLASPEPAPPLFYLWFSYWFGIVAGLGPVYVSLDTIMTTSAACIVTWLIISFMLSESVISVHMPYTSYTIVCFFVHLHLPNWDIKLLTPCNVSGLLCNNNDAVHYYMTLLYAYVQECFFSGSVLNFLHYTWLQLVY